MHATMPIEGVGSIADACKAKIRAMYADCFQPARRIDSGAALWAALTKEERAFLCKLARMDRNAAAVEWVDMPDDFRDALVRAWRRLVEFVGRVELTVSQRARR